MALNALTVLLALGQLGLCAPAPNDLGSDLTILVNNDLLGENSKMYSNSYYFNCYIRTWKPLCGFWCHPSNESLAGIRRSRLCSSGRAIVGTRAEDCKYPAESQLSHVRE
jgi:hypothetical protein